MFDTPEDAEDAYYDALENNELDALLKLWSDGTDCFSILPMMPPALGKQAIGDAYQALLAQTGGLDIMVKHLHWIKRADVAIHVVLEQVTMEGNNTPPIYTVNSFAKNTEGWQMIGHQNSPGMPPTLQPGE